MVGNPYDLLSILEGIDDFQGLVPSKRLFEAACVELVRHRLPAEAISWIRLTEDYHVGRATIEQLTEARIAAWKLSELDGVSKCAMRVLIGLLSPDDHYRDPERARDDVFESIYYSILFASREGVPQERIAKEMQRAFHNFLPSPG
jgi:hypothetical protein